MKATSIQPGKSYEVSVGRGTTIVKVLGMNPKTDAWQCKTQSGKDIAIGDAKRFIKAINDGKGAKKKKSQQSEFRSAAAETIRGKHFKCGLDGMECRCL